MFSLLLESFAYVPNINLAKYCFYLWRLLEMSNSLANLNFFLNTQKISKTLKKLCCLSYNVPIMSCYMYSGGLFTAVTCQRDSIQVLDQHSISLKGSCQYTYGQTCSYECQIGRAHV